MNQSGNRLPASFKWLNATQFFGALNDNLFKLLMAYFLIELVGAQQTTTIMAVSTVVFVVPFLLFSHLAGVLADYYSKRNIAVFAKVLEVFVMLIGGLGFLLNSPLIVYTALFLMSTQSAIFGPSKYGIIPELVAEESLSKANSLLVSFTYIAIILGTYFAAKISELVEGNFVLASLFCVAIASVGAGCSFLISRTPPKLAKRPVTPWFVADIFRTLMSLRGDRHLLLAVLGSAYFLLIGAFMQINIIPYGMEILNLSKEQSTNLFLLGALGIGVGSMLAGWLSGRNIEYGIVPLREFGLTGACVSLGFVSESVVAAGAITFVFGASAGLFIVPLNAFIQYRSPSKRLGEILAASNFLSFFGVLIAAVLLYVFSNVLNLNPASCFVVMACVTLVLTVVSLIVLPDFLVRFIGVMVMRLFYRITIVGSENIPMKGPALIVANHVSWVDALLLMATQQRRVRFVMYRRHFEKKLLNPLLRLMKVIPISFEDSPRRLLRSLKETRLALDEGYLVCIFAEGSITRSGIMQEFKRGFERILKGSDYPIVPTYIGGAWGSIMSYYHGKAIWKIPTSIPYPITIIFGKHMAATSSASEVRLAVMELAGESFELLKRKRKSLGHAFIGVARKNWFRNALSDTTGKSLTYGQTLVASIVVADYLKTITKGERKIGILMPASVGGAIANVAVAMMGKVAVNLNFTASEDSIRSARRQCEIRTIISSRRFVMNAKNLTVPKGTIFLEDIHEKITGWSKLKGFLKALLVPRKMLSHGRGFAADDLATVIFSSGSTAEPKGIMLSHHNIISNVESFRMLLDISPKDKICGSLPFFHSFGYTATLWLPLLSGFAASYHANPLEGSKIAEVVREKKCTILLGTPTFLLTYIRRASREDFRTLRLTIVGAEKLKKRIAQAYEKKFGMKALEGYGTTELSPVTAVNIPDVEIGGVYQVGTKEETVGHPIPGVTVKIVDPDTFETLPTDQPGLLLVKGPNVMLGYLNQPEKTAEVLREGWYNTGDIARLDSDGFITITDRLSRFSKIGGEMIPHIAVEEAYLNSLMTTSQLLVVTSVPDEKRGERLVVLYTEEAGDPETLHSIISSSDLPNLWKPRKDSYVKIDSMPLLGSGKLDLKAIKQIAREAFCGD